MTRASAQSQNYKIPASTARRWLKSREDLQTRQVVPGPPDTVCSALYYVPKSDGGWRRLHNLSSPQGRSVNDQINIQFGHMSFSSIEGVLHYVLLVGKGAIIIKRDMLDAFRNIPVCTDHHKLFGFSCDHLIYEENCLSFGLRTAPFSFQPFIPAWTLGQRPGQYSIRAHVLHINGGRLALRATRREKRHHNQKSNVGRLRNIPVCSDHPP